MSNNIISIDVILLIELQFSNIVNVNNLEYCLSILINFTDMEIIWISLGFYINFDWLKYK